MSMGTLGVIVDSNLKMRVKNTKAYQHDYYHLHNIRSIRKVVSQEATWTIIYDFITNPVDSCKGLMNGPTENLIKELQRVQNTAARLFWGNMIA